MGEQRHDVCPDCGTERTELVVAPERFYCPQCGRAGAGPSVDVNPGVQLAIERVTCSRG